MKHFHKLKEREYNSIQGMLKAGVTKAQVARITSRSYCTVRNVEKSKAWPDYRAIVHQAMLPLKLKEQSGKALRTVTINLDALDRFFTQLR